jgi:hypothetical protein
MKNQILMALGVAIVASVLVTGLTSSIYAQSNMTGGNMTGGNMSMPSATDDGESGDDDGEDDDDNGENEEGEGNN